jgi:prepilin-type processing-associated H-X9-DG protein
LNGRTETSYLAVVGPGTVWPGEKAVAMSQILDGTSSTLLVVEVHDSGISWLEPRDLHISQMPMAVNPKRGQGMNSRHGSTNDRGPGRVAQAAFCDGHTQSLSSKLSPKSLREMLTIAGGETLSFDEE